MSYMAKLAVKLAEWSENHVRSFLPFLPMFIGRAKLGTTMKEYPKSELNGRPTTLLALELEHFYVLGVLTADEDRTVGNELAWRKPQGPA